MANTATAAPTPKQLAFLRALATRTGTTFSYPSSRRQASRQIAQLLKRSASTQLELDLDSAAIRGGDVNEQVA